MNWDPFNFIAFLDTYCLYLHFFLKVQFKIMTSHTVLPNYNTSTINSCQGVPKKGVQRRRTQG